MAKGTIRMRLGWYASYLGLVATLSLGLPSPAHSQWCGATTCDAPSCPFDQCGFVRNPMYSMPGECNGLPFCEVGECVTLSPGMFDLCNIGCTYGTYGRCIWLEV